MVVGETASGKSQLALDLAKRFEGELICADSWTVYRSFNIGTAKPNMAERSAVPHHLLDIVDASDGFNAALFKGLAQATIAEILNRGKLPILVGGTGLYIDCVVYDYSFLPTVDPKVRAERNQRELHELWAEAQRLRIELTGIDTQNKRRVIRALETKGQRPTNSELRDNTLLIGIQTSREELLGRITKRVDKMIAEGLELEVRDLKEKYGWDAEPMKGVGYREWQGYFENSKTIVETREQIISASMNLAKRQRTWLKRNNSIHWVYDPSDAVDLATTFLNKKQ